MEKKLTVQIEEFKQNLARDVANSGLPVVVADLVIKDLYNEIHSLAQETTLKDIQEYNDSMSISV